MILSIKLVRSEKKLNQRPLYKNLNIEIIHEMEQPELNVSLLFKN
jgi:hypothetical protein